MNIAVIGKSSSFAAAVVQKGKLVYSEVCGYADSKNKILITNNTNFRLASVTKQFTALAILLLVENGRLSLVDKLANFFPEFPDYGKDITIFQLLTHSSGLKDYEDLISKIETVQVCDEDVLKLLMSQTDTLFPSGTKYSYNNGGYCLLALIIEKVSGELVGDFFKKKLFAPLGMNSSFVNYEGKTIISNRAYGFPYDQDITSATIGDGGVYSSINDLQKWDQVFYTDIILSKKTREQILTKHIITDEDQSVYYGFGLCLKELNSKNIAYHAGSSIGFQTGIYYVLDEQLAVIFLSNRSGDSGSEICEKILEKMFLT